MNFWQWLDNKYENPIIFFCFCILVGLPSLCMAGLFILKLAGKM